MQCMKTFNVFQQNYCDSLHTVKDGDTALQNEITPCPAGILTHTVVFYPPL